jgi:hypothetical protein
LDPEALVAEATACDASGHSRRIVGSAMSERNDATPAPRALQQDLWSRRTELGLAHHTVRTLWR